MDDRNLSENSRRIARNTVLLYFRMFLLMAVGLYTSRIVLHALGVDDYGIYNAVAGVVTLFTILTGSMTAAISRFLTYQLGKGFSPPRLGSSGSWRASSSCSRSRLACGGCNTRWSSRPTG